MTRIVQGMAMRIALVMMVAMTVAHAQPTDWRRAEPGRVLSVPADHVSHPDYRLEWWYYTGNVTGAEGRAYGYQVTFFRYGLVREPASRSPWAVRDLFMAHVAVTDRATGVHLYEDRINRAGLHWAGARTDRYDVWNETWRVSLDADGRHHLAIDAETFALDLRLEPGKPAVLQGDRGYSRKGSDPGNASHYYSLTRMPTSGTLRIGSKDVRVTGASWMDHEFGSSTLERHVQGWDWFALQLDDGRELMLYRFRRTDGGVDPYSSGTWVAADGASRPLAADAFAIQPRRTWRSPTSHATYPVEWDVSVPGDATRLRVRAVLDAQELVTRRSTGVTYWEGAVEVEGEAAGRPVKGRGYVELTGYAGRPISDVMR
ncbi:MAG: carotenoid 1,2-hydratase [Acidobacteria bacterium]|nr:carotenoid 1,2-hydratase [Acidobacteriota bacterium]